VVAKMHMNKLGSWCIWLISNCGAQPVQKAALDGRWSLKSEQY